MPSDTATAEILAELAAIRDAIKPRKAQPSRRRRQVLLCVTEAERAAIEAAAEARGVNISDLLRIALEPILQLAMPRNRFIPVQLAAHNRRKPSRFDDGKSDLRQMDRADAAKRVVAARLAAQQAMADYGAAVPNAPVMREMIGETAGVPIVPKLSRTGN